ncbi:MAG: cyclic nucleotide-binding domain-containing protein [Betaproteobacteria bacterium]|nr:cyclic nucleotide-binding domain-containing protein [Pseudomonadota bacterium]NDH35567.1 cyclic nucleotide-binding domain-containing protein [Betaproteobacteria bacterium]
MRMRRARQTGSIWPGKAFGIRSGLKLRYSWQVTLASGSQGPMRVLKFVCDGADLMAVPISEVPFFDGMSGEDLAEIMLLTRTKTFAAGQQVFKEDDDPDGLYVVLSGLFRVYVLSRGVGMPKKVLASLKQGAHVGEFGLIDGQPRSASLECESAGDLLFLPAPAFVKIVGSRAGVAKTVTENLCRAITNQKGMIYKTEELKQRIRSGQIPPTVDNMKALCKMLRVSNYTISRS